MGERRDYKTVSKPTCPGEFSDVYYTAENYSHSGAWRERDGTINRGESV